MVGFYARADSTEPIRVDIDGELSGVLHVYRDGASLTAFIRPLHADARWFTRREVLAVLGHPDGTTIVRRDWKVLEEIVTGKPDQEQSQKGADSDTKQAPVGKGIESASDGDVAQANVKGAAAAGGSLELAEPDFRVPPRDAIAGLLIAEWAFGKAKL